MRTQETPPWDEVWTEEALEGRRLEEEFREQERGRPGERRPGMYRSLPLLW